MNIAGFQKLTLLDYPNKTSCTIFTSGCNLNCPFCHNACLIKTNTNKFDESEIYRFLEKRIGLLDGVCITGGEPTIQNDLYTFIKGIKELGFLVKLDTNGTNPTVVENLVENNLIDYIAMDVKNTLGKYNITCGSNNVNTDNIKRSIDFIINAGIDYEFRTTVLKDYHTEADMERLSETLSGCKAYYLQKFIKSDRVNDDRCQELSDEELINYLKIVRVNIPNAELRGVDYDSTTLQLR